MIRQARIYRRRRHSATSAFDHTFGTPWLDVFPAPGGAEESVLEICMGRREWPLRHGC